MKSNTTTYQAVLFAAVVLLGSQAFSQGIDYTVPEGVHGTHSWRLSYLLDRPVNLQEDPSIRERLAALEIESTRETDASLLDERALLRDSAIADPFISPRREFDGPASVPEPSTLALGFAAGLFLLHRRRGIPRQ